MMDTDYKAMLGTHLQKISNKQSKGEKPREKNPFPTKRMQEIMYVQVME